MIEQEVWTVAECAKKGHVTPETIRKWIEIGYKKIFLNADKVGHKYFIFPASWEKFRKDIQGK